MLPELPQGVLRRVMELLDPDSRRFMRCVCGPLRRNEECRWYRLKSLVARDAMLADRRARGWPGGEQ